MTSSVTAAEARSAANFLTDHGIPKSQIQPRRLAAASKQTNKSLSEILIIIRRTVAAGQGAGGSSLSMTLMEQKRL